MGFEEAKGRAKEALGDLTNNVDLQRAGEAQAEQDDGPGDKDAPAAESTGDAGDADPAMG